METMGSYLSPRPEGRASGNLESRFTESPTTPGQQHLQGPDGPSLVLTPGPAAAQLQRHLLSGLPPASHPQPGQQEGLDAPVTTEEGLPFLLPAGQKRLHIPPGGTGWQPVAEGSSPLCAPRGDPAHLPALQHRGHGRRMGPEPPGQAPCCTGSAAHWPASLSQAGGGAARGSPAQGGLQPGCEEILPQSHSLSAREGTQPLCLGGCQSRSHESLLFLNKLAGEIQEQGLTHTWFNTEMILMDQQTTFPPVLPCGRLISTVIMHWIESICQMISGILSDIMIYSTGTTPLQILKLTHLLIHLFGHLFI